jgi:hypothetical protein
MPFFAVAYGSSIRYSHAGTMKGAMKDTYGLVDGDRMSVMQLPKNPKYCPQKTLRPILQKLERQHKMKIALADGKASQFNCDDCSFPIYITPGGGGETFPVSVPEVRPWLCYARGQQISQGRQGCPGYCNAKVVGG